MPKEVIFRLKVPDECEIDLSDEIPEIRCPEAILAAYVVVDTGVPPRGVDEKEFRELEKIARLLKVTLAGHRGEWWFECYDDLEGGYNCVERLRRAAWLVKQRLGIDLAGGDDSGE